MGKCIWKVCAACLSLCLFLQGCLQAGSIHPETTAPTDSLPAVPGFSIEEVAALTSLTRVDDYPLYTMHTTVDYEASASGAGSAPNAVRSDFVPAWACSLFAALGSQDGALYGRNFDWDHSPALLLFTNPPGRFASVSMVDIAYLVPEDKQDHLTELPLVERTELLAAPYWPFDGMNEHGLVIGMAAVPDSQVPQEPGRDGIGSLGIIREMLDHARDVDEALALMENYNIIMEDGPQLHYLLADTSGRAVLVELYDGELKQIPSSQPWHAATNFTLSAVAGDSSGHCPRYDTLTQRLAETNGKLTQTQAMDLLSAVAQPGTQWSVVYGIASGSVSVAMGREYKHTHLFQLSD